MKTIFFDTETTGLPPRNADPRSTRILKKNAKIFQKDFSLQRPKNQLFNSIFFDISNVFCIFTS